MDCDVCGTGITSYDQAKFHCPACARAALYPLRLQQAKLLIDKEKLGKQVEATVTGRQTPHETKKHPEPRAFFDATAASKILHAGSLAEIESSRGRIETIVQKSEELRKQLADYRQERDKRKEALGQRRHDQDAARSRLQASRPTLLEPRRKQFRKSQHRYENLASELSYSRAYLCHSSASILGLRQASPSPSAPARSASAVNPGPTYTLSHLQIPDLRNIHTLSTPHINALLAQVVRLLQITATYLSILLPAEVIPPSADQPLPWILPPSASYLPSPTTATSSSTPDLKLPKPKARPLHLDPKHTLPQLARDRDKSPDFSRFIEAISYLAWNIAWLCRTQGIDLASSTDSSTTSPGDSTPPSTESESPEEKKEPWHTATDIGHNLHALFIHATEQRQIDYRKSLTMSSNRRPGVSRRTTTTDQPSAPDKYRHVEMVASAGFGARTHGTAHSFLPGFLLPPLASTTGANERSERSEHGPLLQDPQQISTALRAHLLLELQGAEWDVVDALEAEEVGHGLGLGGDAGVDEPSVLVGKGKRRLVSKSLRDDGREPGAIGQAEEGHAGAKEGGDADADGEDDIVARTAYADGDPRANATSENAWMKVRDRGK